MGVRELLLASAVPLPQEAGISDHNHSNWYYKLFGPPPRKRRMSKDIGTYITEDELSPTSPSLWSGSPRSPRCPAGTSLPDLIPGSDPRSPPDREAQVFVFPSLSPQPRLSPELQQRLGLGIGESGSEAVPTRVTSTSSSRPGAEPAAEQQLTAAGRSLRELADQWERTRRQAPVRRRGLQQLLPCTLETAVLCWVTGLTLGCVFYKLCK